MDGNPQRHSGPKLSQINIDGQDSKRHQHPSQKALAISHYGLENLTHGSEILGFGMESLAIGEGLSLKVRLEGNTSCDG